jgi:hypothetical protein
VLFLPSRIKSTHRNFSLDPCHPLLGNTVPENASSGGSSGCNSEPISKRPRNESISDAPSAPADAIFLVSNSVASDNLLRSKFTSHTKVVFFPMPHNLLSDKYIAEYCLPSDTGKLPWMWDRNYYMPDVKGNIYNT